MKTVNLFLHLLFHLLLYALSVKCGIVLELNGQPLSGNVSCGSYRYYEVNMTEPCLDMNITLSNIVGSPEIYVSKTLSSPTKADRTWSSVDYTVSITQWDPESSMGMYYIGVYADCSISSTPATFTIQAVVSEGKENLLVNPSLAINQVIAAEKYQYYRFCLSQCADVKVTLQNCMNDSVCPEAYSFPEMLLSRTEVSPTVYDYSYKLADYDKRSIVINHTDPNARDHNNYLRGSFYLGVYGWCTPDSDVVNNATDGPCSYASRTLYNVTIEILQTYPNEMCAVNKLVYSSVPSPLHTLQFDETVNGTVPCGDYVYYTISVPDPCSGLLIYVGNSTLANSVPELAVGRYPNLAPRIDGISWTSYNWGYQLLPIDAYDPNFYGGDSCGFYRNTSCYYTIGVFGYCANPAAEANGSLVDYILRVSPLNEGAQNIFGTSVVRRGGLEDNQLTGSSSFSFCYSRREDVYVHFLRHHSCNCVSSYANLQLVLSDTKRDASIGDYAWTIDHDEELNYLALYANDATVQPGTYYVNVYGWCEEDDKCDDKCTCSPCSHLANVSYGVLVDYDSKTPSLSSAGVEDCSSKDLGSCPQTCSSDVNGGGSNDDDDDDNLSANDIAGVTIGVACGVVIIIVLIYFSRKHCGQNEKGFTSIVFSPSADEEREHLSQHAANNELVDSKNSMVTV